MKAMENKSRFPVKIMGTKSAIFDDNKVDEFFDNQVAYLQNWIENSQTLHPA